MTPFEIIPHIPVGEWVRDGVDWINRNLDGLLSWISVTGSSINNFLADMLLALPPIVMVLLFALFAWVVRSWRLALGVLLSFLLIISMGQWTTSMQTLALVLLATITAIVIAVPLGILAAKNNTVSAIVRPVLDLMQTLPAFVYLIPAVTFFSIGVVPGLFATIIFALPPGVRFTELGIRQVDEETVEAGESFGATPWMILRGIQLPLAIPTIMAGINQVIMLALSMAVIAGMVGADGLGKEVTGALATVNIAKGAEAGLSIVFLAIFLDRATAALGNPSDYPASLLGMWRNHKHKLKPATQKAVSLAAVLALVLGIGGLAVAAIAPKAITGADNKGTIKMGYIPSWSDGRSMANLLKVQFESMGHEVVLTELSDNGPLYAGLAQGDIDLIPSAWPEVTHKAFMDEYGDSIEDVGTYYGSAKLTWAVPEYSEIQSIEDIPQYADELGNKIIGIEPGAGLTEASQEQVIPQYGLDDFEVLTSSTNAMLAELNAATDANKEIVVTLWRPFWANSTFGMRDLEDPKGALGEAEGLHFLGKQGFAEEFPEAAAWLSEFKLSDEEYDALEDKVMNEFEEGQEIDAVKAWAAEHPGMIAAAGAAGAGGGEKGTATIAYVPSWSDTRVMAAVEARKFEEFGYDVEFKTLSELGPLYAALAQGDVDVYSSAMPERNHAAIVQEYEGQFEDLGVYFPDGGNFLAVPEYSAIKSIEDLSAHADALDGKIVGIEPGAGLTSMTEQAMEDYGLNEDFELLTSSTHAMLAQLTAATEKQEEIVVTLWQPFWAVDAYDMRILEDPKNSYGGPEGMHVLARTGFTEDFPDMAEWVKDFELTSEELGALEDLVLNKYEEGEEQQAIDEWLESFPDALD